MNLNDILNEKIKESNTLELKKSENQLPKDFWKTYSAYANTIGGIVILGLHQKNDVGEIIVSGVSKPDNVVKDLFNQANDKNKVNYNLISDEDIQIQTLEDINGVQKNIIIISIPEAPVDKKPIYLNNNPKQSYKRIGDGDRLLSDDELKYYTINSQNDIDNELLTNYDLEDLNIESIEKYKHIVSNIRKENEKYLDMDNLEFLKAMGVFRKDRKENIFKLTTGGLIFFGKYNSICDRFPKFQLDYFEKKSSLSNSRWEDRVSTGDMLYPEMNMFEFYLTVIEKLYLTAKDKFSLDNETSRRLPFKESLQNSLREALVNSLMHAYYDSSTSIKIEAFEDYYEFTNPGEMRVSIDDFIRGGVSNMRNTIIPNLFRRIGIAEKAGSGGEAIFDFANEHGLKTPEIDDSNQKTFIRIWKVDLKHNINNLESETEKIIMHFIIDNSAIARKDMMRLGISEHHSKIAIENLIKNKFIIKVGKSSATRYVLHQNTPEQYYNLKQSLKNIEDSISRLNIKNQED